MKQEFQAAFYEVESRMEAALKIPESEHLHCWLLSDFDVIQVRVVGVRRHRSSNPPTTLVPAC